MIDMFFIFTEFLIIIQSPETVYNILVKWKLFIYNTSIIKTDFFFCQKLIILFKKNGVSLNF